MSADRQDAAEKRSGLVQGTMRGTAVVSVASFAAFCVLVALNAHAPAPALVAASGLSATLTAFAAAASVVCWLAVKWGSPQNRRPILIIAAITVAVLALHLAIVDASGSAGCVVGSSGSTGCIGDEVYYVPAAQTLINGTQCSPSVAGCNLEHPFLGKAIVAAGMVALGQNALGERAGSILFGTLSIPVLFLLVYAISGDRRLGYFAAAFLALDPTFFALSSAAFLDVPSLFLVLCAFLAYFADRRVWRLDGLTQAAIILGVAALAKETAVFGFLALVVYHTLFKEEPFSAWVRDVARSALVTGGVLAAGVQAYVSVLARGTYSYFFQQLGYLLGYGASLIGTGWTDAIRGTPITPLSWVSLYTPVGLLTVRGSSPLTGPGGVPLYPSVGYYVAINVVLSWTLYLWVAVAALLAFRHFMGREPQGGLDGAEKALMFAGVWFACVFIPYVGLWLFGRDTYPYYAVLATPAMAAGTGYLLTRTWFSRWAACLVLGVAALGFVYFFPVKGVMPVWLRALFPR